ncbi:MAG TPA: D-2-hydroxyacid dehydrogenase [Clostridia bacterium]|jgi:phosphoglycerate dehydrogenase-like enzyme|nr:D-2-hydroxyacid dehydrogenase [Clostridia bacterium]
MARRVLINAEMPEYLLGALETQYPQFTFTVVNRNSPELWDYLSDTEILISFQCDKEMVDNTQNLRWIQLLRVGLDGVPLTEIFKRGIILTNAHGIHKNMMAEYAIAAMINLSRNWHLVFKNQLKARWDRSVPQGEINGAIVGILGLGSIGKEIAKRAKFFGMKVLGTKSNPQPVADVDEVYGSEQMAEVFKQSDYIINLLPLTTETRGLIGQKYFKLMKPTASFINIGRGATVNEADLIKALKEKQFYTAVLDVFEEEPLPSDHPLWKLENVILTPHFSGSSSKYLDKVFPIITHNLGKYLAEKPGEMINPVKSDRGY